TDDGVRSVYAAHGGELYRFARRALGDDGLAEEAVQETFVRAWQAADRFDERLGSLRTWLFAILRNVVIDLSRARAVRPPLALADPARVTGRDERRVPPDLGAAVVARLHEEQTRARTRRAHRRTRLAARTSFAVTAAAAAVLLVLALTGDSSAPHVSVALRTR